MSIKNILLVSALSLSSLLLLAPPLAGLGAADLLSGSNTSDTVSQATASDTVSNTTNTASNTSDIVSQSQDSTSNIDSLASTKSYIGIGNTSVMPNDTKKTTAVVVVTLSSPITHRTNFSYKTTAGSALAGTDYVTASGSSFFSSNNAVSTSVQRDIDISIQPQKLSTPASFDVTLSGITKGATAVNDIGVITLLPNQPTAPTSTLPLLSVGDSSMYKSISGVNRVLETSITLSKPLTTSLNVSYKTVSDVGITPQDYKSKSGEVTFSPGQVQKAVTITISNNANNLPNRIFYVDISTTSAAVSIVKSTSDQILINGSNTGLVTTTNPGLNVADLTPDRSVTTHLFDNFVINNSTASTTISGKPSNNGANSRFVFYPTTEQPSLNQQTCATWQSQAPANGSGTIIQEGLALRVSNSGGVTKAITITKNIYGSNNLQRPANATFDIILWDTRVPNFNFTGILGTTLTSLWPSGQYVPMPWNICGKVVGDIVSFVVWPSTMSQPAWNDPNYSGSATIPADDLSNWTYPGYAGWYFGHATKTSSEVYTNMSTQNL